jgi:hypothetical protein
VEVLLVEIHSHDRRLESQTAANGKSQRSDRGLKNAHLTLSFLEIVPEYHGDLSKGCTHRAQLQEQIDHTLKAIKLEQLIAVPVERATQRGRPVCAVATREIANPRGGKQSAE